MTRYLLDTNILSEGTKPNPSPVLERWLAAQTDTSLFISTMTLAELRYGILLKDHGKKRTELENWFEQTKVFFDGRVLPFEANAAMVWAELMRQGKAHGRPRDTTDTIIAATALAHDCVVVTANTRDFDDVETLNPM